MNGIVDTKQIELHFEKANMAAETVDRGKGLIVLGVITAGKSLLEAKELVPHGEWAIWLGKHWDHSQSLASKYMKIANSERVPNLKDAKSIREALSLAMSSDDGEQEEVAEPGIVPRAERKTGRVKVETPPVMPTDEDPHAHHETDSDDDPNPAPKTNTKHSPATAKAKEADRPAPQVVTPVIVEEPKQWPDVSLEDLITGVIKNLEHEKQKKAAAKTLRKLADSLDPPAIGAPSIEAVQEWAQQRGISDFDADKFFAHYALAGWKYGKAKTPIKDWKLAAINAYSGGKGWAVDGANRLPF